MIPIKKIPTVAGVQLGKELFSLPVGGCRLVSTEWLDEKEYCRVKGWIDSVDPKAEGIEFQVNLPYNWNRKTIQYGGGGFDGTLVTAEEYPAGQKMTNQPPPSRGFVTYGSDGGHREKGPWDASWSWNDEMLLNFAHQQLKKTHDAAMAVIKLFYDGVPQYNYFAGGSNGGREALKVAQLYPQDYDGILCFFPVLNWVEKAIKDADNATYIEKAGAEGLIDPATYSAFRAKVLEICGKEDGLIHDLSFAATKEAEVKEAASKILNPTQFKVVEHFAKPMRFAEPIANDLKVMPGYVPFAGAPLATVVPDMPDMSWSHFPSAPGKRDGVMALFGDGVLRYQILRDQEEYDPMTFSVEEHREQLETAAKLLDATNPDLKAFHDRGGKMILVHGLADQLVTPLGTIAYYESVKKLWDKEELDSFLRFYLIPGYGHGYGEDFMMGTSIVEMLDEWVTLGQEPESFIAGDDMPGHSDRTMLISRYSG